MSLVQMSVSGAVMILVIVVIRTLLLHKLPKRAFLFLWGLVLVRLLIPYTLPCSFSAYSLLSGIGTETSPPVSNPTPPPVTDFTPGNAPFEPDLSPDSTPAPAPEVPPENGLPFDIGTAVWIAGMAACSVFFAVSYIKCRVKFRESLPVENSYITQWLSENRLRRRLSVRRSDRIAAPLTYGVFRPVILLPKKYEAINEDDLRFVLAHEYVHIRRFDAVFKLLLTAAVCVHWFNPLVWAMYVIANKDIEISCDEAVITMLGEREKKSYAMTLIRLEEIKSGFTPLINSFGNNAIKERIVTIMKFKKTTALTAAAAAFLIVGITTAFATSAKAPDSTTDSTPVNTNNSVTASNDSSNEDIAGEVINLDIGEYEPGLVSEGIQRYDEQKAKYGKMLPDDYTDIPRESTYGIMTDIDNLMVSHMKYINDKDWKPDIYTDSNGGKVITLDYLDMQNAEIVFEDGSAASENNLLPGTSVLVEYNTKDEIYPGVLHCTKILIMNENKTPQAPDASTSTSNNSEAALPETKISVKDWLKQPHSSPLANMNVEFDPTGKNKIYPADLDTEVLAIEDGEVVYAEHGFNKGWGSVIILKHSGDIYTLYGHLENNHGINVSVGDTVKAGQCIGYVGMSGMIDKYALEFRCTDKMPNLEERKTTTEPVPAKSSDDYDYMIPFEGGFLFSKYNNTSAETDLTSKVEMNDVDESTIEYYLEKYADYVTLTPPEGKHMVLPYYGENGKLVIYYIPMECISKYEFLAETHNPTNNTIA